MLSQPASQKTRHYAHLASRLKTLQSQLAETELCMQGISEHLNGMAKLGAYSGSQFMAASRLLDVDLEAQTSGRTSQPEDDGSRR